MIKVLGDRGIASYSSSDAGKFRDWLLEKGMTIRTVKRVFSSVRAIINLTISEQGVDCNNAFSRTYMPEDDKVSFCERARLSSLSCISLESWLINSLKLSIIVIITY